MAAAAGCNVRFNKTKKKEKYNYFSTMLICDAMF